MCRPQLGSLEKSSVSTEEQKEIDERDGGEPSARLGREPADEEHAAGDEQLAAGGADDADDADDDAEVDAHAHADGADARPRDEEGEDAKITKEKAASAGARLAAAKAAKAAKKAAKKSRENATVGPAMADTTKQSIDAIKESSIGQAAAQASEWAKTNRNLAIGIFSVIVLAALGWVSFGWWRTSQAEAAGSLLETALEIATAEIRPTPADEDASPSDESADAPTFVTREERAEASLEAYRRVTQEYGSSAAAPWARLGEARALFELGQIEESRAAYEQALAEAGGDPMIAWRALEGIGFTYEVGEDWATAIEKYEELRTVEDGAYQGPADYHIARMRLASGETVQATTALRELVTRLRADGEEPAFPYVLAQAELRLRELDPSSAPSSSAPSLIGPGAGQLPEGLEGIDPQILEQLRRQLQQQGAGTGEGE